MKIATATATYHGGRKGTGQIRVICPHPGDDAITQLRNEPGAKWDKLTHEWTFDCNASTARLIVSLVPDLTTDARFDHLLTLGKYDK